MELDASSLLCLSCQVHVKFVIWLFTHFLQVLHVALINCTQVLLRDPCPLPKRFDLLIL